MTEMLRLEGVAKRFGRLTAVRDLSLSVETGAIHGLIGPNGSGKTTTFNLISGFLRPSLGAIRLDGRDIAGLRPHQIARLGLVRTFQITSVYRHLTVMENIAMGQHLVRRRTMSNKAIPDPGCTAAAVLEFMGLEDFAGHSAQTLPAGTQRVLSIAIAMAAAPSMLLLDEPLAGLNATEKANVSQKILRLREQGLTILLIEHDVRSVLSLCERVTVVHFGEKIAEGTGNEITRIPRVIEAYLGRTDAHHA